MANAKREPKAPAAEPEDDGPRDIDEFRYSLTRDIANLLGHARHCRDRACRRARRCAAHKSACVSEAPMRPMSEAQKAAALAKFYRVLERRTARRK